MQATRLEANQKVSKVELNFRFVRTVLGETCATCDRDLPPGERYTRHEKIIDGFYYSEVECLACYDFYTEFCGNPDDESESMNYVNSMTEEQKLSSEYWKWQNEKALLE